MTVQPSRKPLRSLFVFAFLLAALSIGFAVDRQSGADYRVRRVALAAKTSGLPVVLFAAEESPEGLTPFRQDNDFFYLSGWAEPGAALLIAPEVKSTATVAGHPYTEILFLPLRNLRRERWTGPKLGAEDPKAPGLTGFDKVLPLDDLAGELNKLNAGAILSDTSEEPNETAATRPLQWIARATGVPELSVRDVKPLLLPLRTYKDAGEIERIRHATDASISAHQKALKAIKPGLYEYQIAAIMKGEFEYLGCERPAYAPIVGTGLNSTVLHYSDNTAQIHDGDLIVMDVAGEYGLYASDITRTAPANGHFTARQREIYNIVLGAQHAAEQAFVSGKSLLRGQSPESLYKVVVDYFNTHGKDLHGQPLGQYFIHGLGHPVGLEVHDVGTYGSPELPLGPGSVFTLEPGLYIPEEKIGVRIEDLYLVDKDGKLVRLTAPLPHTAEEVENAMNK